VLGESIGLKDYNGRICFYPTTHMNFPGSSVTPGSSNVWFTDSECMA